MQAEFLYKVKPKLDKQFKVVEENGVPMTVIIGEDELAEGKVRIKENGLREGHPEKNGVLISMSNLVPEIKERLKQKAYIDGLAQEAEGLRVVGGVKGEPEQGGAPKPETSPEETAEAIGAVPAS